MKKVFLFGAVALSLSLVSCNKEEQTEKTLNGAWTVTSLDGTVVSTDQGQTDTYKLKNGSGKITLDRANATGSMNVMYDLEIPFGGTFLTVRDTTSGTITLWNNSDKDVSITLRDNTGSTQNIGFGIVTNEKKAQEWSYNQKNVDGTQTVDLNYTMKLTKN